MKLHWEAILFTLIELTIFVNLIILDVTVFGKLQSIPATPPTTTTAAVDTCGITCQNTIRAQIRALATPAPEILPTTAPSQVPSAKEFFIPLGLGATLNDQWEDIPGVTGYIDSRNYTHIQTVYFEVSMRIPTKNGIASARLYNVTDKHPVWNSEVVTSQDVSTLVSSQIKLDSGNKQYQVQMKTSLRYLTMLDFARIKIITK